MISSHANSRRAASSASPVNVSGNFSVASTQKPFGEGPVVTPGSANDAILMRSVISDAMRRSTKSRAELADLMTLLSGSTVTEIQLNKYAAESRSDYRLPAELLRAFCVATNDFRLLTCGAEAVGLHLVDDDALALMELGREYLRQKRAAAAVASLELRLEGVAI